MTLHFTIDLRAVLIGFALLVAVGIATPFAISLADDGPTGDRVSEQRAVLGTAFTYQGRLDTGSGPANGTYDFKFTLLDALTVGNVVAGPFAVDNVSVANGLFSADLDFGAAAFNGQARWLSVEAKAHAAIIYETLAPRQPLTPTPYALFALNAWSLTGNAGTTGANFLGTTDNTALELRVNGQRALRLEPNATSPNIIGGHRGNVISPLVVGGTIGGGGKSIFVNSVGADYGTVAGGYDNTASGGSATVAGGQNNTASGGSATVGGGQDNAASNSSATVGGGFSNVASVDYATVGGGNNNIASGLSATVGGGASNTASNSYATVGGGRDNAAAGDYSFAGGRRAKANGDGIFTWADSSNFDFVSTTPNSFRVRATGGFRFVYGIDGGPNSIAQSCLLTQATLSWDCPSDRNLKTNFADVDGRDVLAKLEGVPIQRWTVKSVADGPPHMGPMAQDFFAAFGLGDSDTSISTIDLDGVALAAIKGLHAITKEQEQRIATLEARLLGSPAPQANAVREAGGIPASAAWALAAMLGLFALSIFALAAVQLRRKSAPRA